MRFVDVVGAVLFPARCVGCGVSNEPVCATCRASVPNAPAIPAPVGVDTLWAPFAYDGPIRDVVAQVKYRGQRHAVAWLAKAMAEVTADALAHEAVGMVTWIPTTPARRRQRGFDHAELLARALGRQLGCECPVIGSLRANHVESAMDGSQVAYASQTGRSAVDRHARARFAATRRCDGITVLLVDDVATTGATLHAGAAALRVVGAARVLAVTAARTAPPRRRRIQPNLGSAGLGAGAA